MREGEGEGEGEGKGKGKGKGKGEGEGEGEGEGGGEGMAACVPRRKALLVRYHARYSATVGGLDQTTYRHHYVRLRLTMLSASYVL